MNVRGDFLKFPHSTNTTDLICKSRKENPKTIGDDQELIQLNPISRSQKKNRKKPHSHTHKHKLTEVHERPRYPNEQLISKQVEI